jgi:aminotransferase
MTDVGHWEVTDDVAFALQLIREAKVATVPGSAFYSTPELGRSKVRFCFPKKMETLLAAVERLRNFRNK